MLLEANMATEAGLIVLDVLNLMSNTFRVSSLSLLFCLTNSDFL